MKRIIFTLAIVFTAILFTSCEPETETLTQDQNQTILSEYDTGKDEVQDDDV